ncbi:conserved telomere maintenance component 1 isoform X3 [Carex rostrata]
MGETLTNISVSDLLRLDCPVNGAASLQPSSSRPLKRIKLEKTLLSNPNPSRKTFNPISFPVLLVGTVNFFSELSDHRTSSCLNHCLSFSDSSSTICCYIVDFDSGILGREIHVMAWNYLPIEQCNSQGVLEIIQWSFPSLDTDPCRSFSLPLKLAQDSGVKANSSAFGVVKSVSLTFTLPIETAEMGDSVGFLAEILTCLCDSCAKRRLNEKSVLHQFTESKVVYFIKPTHKWRPVFAKLVGKVMYLSGLKKRMVVVRNESHIMLVSTIKTKVSLGASIVSDLPTKHRSRGAYKGIVTGIYLHGVVVELDKKVWLLIHDTLLVPHHSLRIGAIVSVRDFHVVRANFAWAKVIILGTCVMTRIHIDSFAFSDTKVFVKTKEKSVLGNFVESLKLSTKFWALLTVSCFKSKFRTVLPDKELLGSNNSAGLVQTYMSRSLPPDVFHPHNSMFGTFSNHDECTYSTGQDQAICKLVVPLSNFVEKCEELWIAIQSEMSENSDICYNTCDGISYPGFIRRIIPSDDFGCILMGNIRTCSSSGRLSLVDATGDVEVVIPDLPSDVNVQTIYEVRDYKVVLEGFRIETDTSVYDFGEPLSCSAIFKSHTYRKKIHGLVLYVQFYLKNSVCLTSPSHVPSNLLHSANHGAHLLVISHKFPLTNNLLRIGSCYLLNCFEGFSPTRECKCLERGGSLIVTENTLRSLSLSFSDDIHQREPSGTSLDELVLLKSLSELHEIVDLKSVSSCMQLMFQRSRIVYGSRDLEGERLAQGELISVCGKIDAFHVSDCDSEFFVANSPGNSNQSGNNICIHLADDHQMVIIRGNLSRKLYPVGIGTGANATFHRLLLTCSSNRGGKLLLTPATYIEINSVREVKTNVEPNQQMIRVDLIESLCNIPALGLFSDFHNADLKVTRFHCRVLTLNVLVLESCSSGSVPSYKIPLAGFVLDDGSALCNCWTDDDQASTLLSLPDICSSFFSSDFSSLERSPKRLLASGLGHSSNSNGSNKNMVGYYLVHMLKKHHKVTVKNRGISLDISCQDLSFHSGTGKIFSILEERLLNYIILNSCQGPTFSATGSDMDVNAVKQFHTYITEWATLRRCAQNIWFRDVAHIDPLKDALNMLRDIKIRMW